MKTPMQEMLEWVNDYPTEVPTIHKSAVIAKAKEMLEKERDVMIEFADSCFDEINDQIHLGNITYPIRIKVIIDHYDETINV